MLSLLDLMDPHLILVHDDLSSGLSMMLDRAFTCIYSLWHPATKVTLLRTSSFHFIYCEGILTQRDIAILRCSHPTLDLMSLGAFRVLFTWFNSFRIQWKITTNTKNSWIEQMFNSKDLA